ncbi:MAG: cupin domain-containing protein [Fimbriimonadaceae bacterium]|nr:cupin domain-containing protein [Fimbriimonadaceae bacterium]
MVERPELFHVQENAGHMIEFMGQRLEFLQSDANVSVFLNDSPPGEGAPMHVHHEMDEACYVLSGRVRFVSGDEVIDAGPGDYVSCARGVVHGFVTLGNDVCRLLWICTPGGYDAFFEAMNQVPIGPEGPDMAALGATATKFQTDLVGPMPSAD